MGRGTGGKGIYMRAPMGRGTGTSAEGIHMRAPIGRGRGGRGIYMRAVGEEEEQLLCKEEEPLV